ncbi:cytochrome b [Pseudidiomarina andamanensis]|uniref:Cytochrome b n=1 Tax=Pseudidiomarina andamanensis TaxID=1940690 RepID=A0AA92IMJ0_9GAMM|nr:cytochrome b [Pseudidiomarina andamanensis]MDS0219461.1 cytochrome b [Pseudidiomarina andamanensis]QGT96179.1 cytochrome b [Pseudidiomarina andamanensis]
MLKNTTNSYGWIAIVIHWLSALMVIGLFALGYWMLTLGYYDSWYRLGPWWHKSFGITLLALTVIRLLWKFFNATPKPLGTHFDQVGARVGHALIYALLLVTMVSGYLISTADGRGISVFDWFEIPALITSIPQQEDIAGAVHWYTALALVILAAGHALAALKHHFVNKDSTLTRMLVAKRNQSNND